uniref:Oligopeptide transporter n=1 Tax=Rhizophora mucronata TaxID=61149 RepID=A0A2P2ILF5_RHIMU
MSPSVLLEFFGTLVIQVSLLWTSHRGIHVPISCCSDNHLKNSAEWIAINLSNTVPVSSTSKQKNKQGSYHQSAGNPEPNGPIKIILDVN